jgi:dihydroorotase-like cyclic amidohydrolase
MTVTADLLIRARRAVTGDAAESERPLAVGVIDGRVHAVEPLADSGLSGRDTLELGEDVVLLPGLVDSHVHVCEPGHTDWEGFASATRAAAAGGVTTLVDMPLDSVPATVSAGALAAKRRAADGQCHVDVGFWGGVIPGNTPELAPLARARSRPATTRTSAYWPRRSPSWSPPAGCTVGTRRRPRTPAAGCTAWSGSPCCAASQPDPAGRAGSC